MLAVWTCGLLVGSRAVRGELFEPKFSLDTNPIPSAQVRRARGCVPAVHSRSLTAVLCRAVAQHWWQRALSYCVVHAAYARALLWPLHLSADYSFNALPVVQQLSGRTPTAHAVRAVCVACTA